MNSLKPALGSETKAMFLIEGIDTSILKPVLRPDVSVGLNEYTDWRKKEENMKKGFKEK